MFHLETEAEATFEQGITAEGEQINDATRCDASSGLALGAWTHQMEKCPQHQPRRHPLRPAVPFISPRLRERSRRTVAERHGGHLRSVERRPLHRMHRACKISCIALGILTTACASTAGNATSRPALIQSHGAKATATAGNATVDEYNSAEVVILALDAVGAGISVLAPAGHTGTSVGIIPLPSGWQLATKLVPAEGCNLSPTHIYNDGEGGYTLSLISASTTGPCPWSAGEYHYLLRINANGYQGGTIGKIVIEY